MTTSHLGSFMINSGRMSLAAGVSMSGWRPGLSPFMMNPILDNIRCEPGLWHIVRNRDGLWTNDVFGLIHSDETENSSIFVPVRSIISFQTWGKLRIRDTMYPQNTHQKCVFNIHPDKWGLVGCAKESSPAQDNLKLFIIHRFIPQSEPNKFFPFHIKL